MGEYSGLWTAAKHAATSLEHLVDHYPKHLDCRACMLGNLQPHNTNMKHRGYGPPPTNFGDQVTAYHIYHHSERCQGLSGDIDALLIYGRASTWIDCYPIRSKSADDAYNRFIYFMGPYQQIKYVYTDDRIALEAVIRQLGIPFDWSMPGRPQTNGVVERQVKEVLFGTRTLLRQAGLPD